MTAGSRMREHRATASGHPEDFCSGVHRYRDPRFDAVAVKVFPGEHYVTADPDEMLVTVLGSCVSACIRDPSIGIGGMNHFMLPESGGTGWDGEPSSSMRYGNVAMERLINDILIAGGLRTHLEIKVFGGGNVMRGNSNIGHRNAEFVEHYLAAEGLRIAASDLRGKQARRIHFFPATGRVMLLELRRTDEQAVADREIEYTTQLRIEPVSGSVELF